MTGGISEYPEALLMLGWEPPSTERQNCGFGGPDNRYLYVTGRGVVYRIQTLNAGVKDRGK